jgi:hypothetical protein
MLYKLTDQNAQTAEREADFHTRDAALAYLAKGGQDPILEYLLIEVFVGEEGDKS